MRTSTQPQAPHTSGGFFPVAGMVWGSIVIVVAFLLSRLGLFNILEQGIGIDTLIMLICILGAAIPGTIIAWIVFRILKKQASSARVRLGVSAVSGIVGGLIVALATFASIAAWFLYEYCCERGVPLHQRAPGTRAGATILRDAQQDRSV